MIPTETHVKTKQNTTSARAPHLASARIQQLADDRQALSLERDVLSERTDATNRLVRGDDDLCGADGGRRHLVAEVARLQRSP